MRLAHAPLLKNPGLRLRDGRRNGGFFPLLAGLVIIGSGWLFLGVMEDVVSHDPLVAVNVVVHQTLQKLRTPLMDSVMVAVTELGDIQVVLPVVVVALAWFVWRRLWHTSLWLAAAGTAHLLVRGLTLVLRRVRPGARYDGLESYSFPSGHARVSVVACGLLAFLVCREPSAAVKSRIALGAALIIVCIAFSRLYLGVQWASDLIIGMGFGLAWIGALALAPTYSTHEHVKPEQLSAWPLATLLLSGSWHAVRQHQQDAQRYARAAHPPSDQYTPNGPKE